jgi:type IV pilus assembly protein PilC
MPYFTYEAREKSGRYVKNQIFSVSKEELVKTLQQAGLTILSVKESSEVEVRFQKRRHLWVRSGDLLLLSKELAVLLENGIPIVEAFEVILKQVESTRLLDVLKRIKSDLESGSSLRDATSKHPRIFGHFWQDMIEAGEISGQLSFVMRQISEFLKARAELIKKIVNALLYPALLFVLAIFSVSIFVFRIVPVFEEFYQSFDTKLPTFTLVIVGISYTIRNYSLLVLQFVIIGGLILRKVLTTRRGRRFFENILFGTPLLGSFLMSVSIQGFISMLSVLSRSGIPIIKALETSKKATRSFVFDELIEEAKAKVIGGLQLSEALHQTGIFPTLAVQLIFVGEKTGTFSVMLDEVSLYYQDVVDNTVTRFTSLLGPVILICMAVLIGSLVAAMFLPIFNLMSI